MWRYRKCKNDLFFYLYCTEIFFFNNKGPLHWEIPDNNNKVHILQNATIICRWIKQQDGANERRK